MALAPPSCLRVRPRSILLPSVSSWNLSTRLRFLPSPTGPPCRHTSSRSGSSSQWLSRQRRDPFVRSRSSSDPTSTSNSSASETTDLGSSSFVARSAFKLLQLHSHSVRSNRGGLIKKGMTIVDLGASPGGWIQACRQILSEQRKSRKRGSDRPTRIIGLDLLPLHRSIADLDDVEFIQGDFLDPIIQLQLVRRLGDNTHVDLVLSDMLANLTGSPLRDAQLSIDLCQAALSFALRHLGPDSTEDGKRTRLIIKCLQSDLSDQFGTELRRSFQGVRWEKPSSSRAESREGYWICSGLRSRSAAELERDTGQARSDLEEGSLYF